MKQTLAELLKRDSVISKHHNLCDGNGTVVKHTFIPCSEGLSDEGLLHFTIGPDGIMPTVENHGHPAGVSERYTIKAGMANINGQLFGEGESHLCKPGEKHYVIPIMDNTVIHFEKF